MRPHTRLSYCSKCNKKMKGGEDKQKIAKINNLVYKFF
jgi:hypothetical protein